MVDILNIKPDVQLVKKNGIFYKVDATGSLETMQSWLGDAFAFLYDRIMEKSIFPKKFAANLDMHHKVLSNTLSNVHQQNVLELGTGSGVASQWLNTDNRYVGVDVSPGLMKKAVKKFADAGFDNAQFYIANVEELPFNDDQFDLCLSVLTLNFFNNADVVFAHVHRVLKPNGRFVCCVPVPERNQRNSTLHGVLRTEKELAQLCEKSQFTFKSLDAQNGAIFYFLAQPK